MADRYGARNKREIDNMMKVRRNVLSRPCPYCGAKKGERCRSPDGTERVPSKSHAARLGKFALRKPKKDK